MVRRLILIFRVQRDDDDVTIKVLFCGLCHTNLHVIKNEFGNTMYLVVPGHEVIGVVTDVGRGVTKFKAGDTVRGLLCRLRG